MSTASGKWTEENFKVHCAESPEIYDKFVEFSLIAARHRERFSAKCVCERIRWETMIGDKNSQFKIDNGWVSHYARKFMRDFPAHKDLFATRQMSKSHHTGEVAS